MLRYQANPNAAAAVAKVLSLRESKLLEGAAVSASKLAQVAQKKPKLQGASIELDVERAEQIRSWIALARLFLEGALELLGRNDNPFKNPEAFQDLDFFSHPR